MAQAARKSTHSENGRNAALLLEAKQMPEERPMPPNWAHGAVDKLAVRPLFHAGDRFHHFNCCSISACLPEHVNNYRQVRGRGGFLAAIGR